MISKMIAFLMVITSAYACNRALVQASNTTQAMQPLFEQTIIVPPRHLSFLQFTVPSDWNSGHIIGHFTATGGSGNDIQVIVTNSDGYINLTNGHQAMSWYDSGKVTVGTFDLRLAPGLYYLVLNNSFALVSNKAVVLDVQMGP